MGLCNYGYRTVFRNTENGNSKTSICNDDVGGSRDCCAAKEDGGTLGRCTDILVGDLTVGNRVNREETGYIFRWIAFDGGEERCRVLVEESMSNRVEGANRRIRLTEIERAKLLVERYKTVAGQLEACNTSIWPRIGNAR